MARRTPSRLIAFRAPVADAERLAVVAKLERSNPSEVMREALRNYIQLRMVALSVSNGGDHAAA